MMLLSGHFNYSTTHTTRHEPVDGYQGCLAAWISAVTVQWLRMSVLIYGIICAGVRQR